MRYPDRPMSAIPTAPNPPAQPTARANRIIGAVVFLSCFGLLAFANHLDNRPDAHGHQTTLGSYGFPGCGFKEVTGLPCATCGMTRCFTYMARGEFGHAVRMQPAGALLATGVAVFALMGGWAMVTGMAMGPLMGAIWRPRHVIIGLVVLLAIWVFNIARTLGGSFA